METYFEGLEDSIAPLDLGACERSREKWNSVAKPIGALGVLEDYVVQMAGLVGTEDVRIDKRCVVVMCADHGVVEQGVSQCGQEVTRAVARAIGQGVSSVCAMARPHGIDVIGVDMGMADPGLLPTPENQMAYDAGMPLMPAIEPLEGMLDRAVGRATGDIAYGPAMTRVQALDAVKAGMELAGDLARQGYQLIGAGEMGIGNTTSASALVSALIGVPASLSCGRGAGLSDEGYARKLAAVERALAANPVGRGDPFGALASLGGFEIAGMCGLCIGGALHRVAVVVDGFISAVSALIASMLCPSSAISMIASHASSEPAARLVAEALDQRSRIEGARFEPVIDAGMHLGEGAGAVCLVPLLDSALALYNGTTFHEEGITPYEVFG